MYVSHEHKAAFSASMRTASRSIARGLMDVGWEKVVGHHAESELPGDYRRFCVTRPHWEVLASVYHGRQSFEEFLTAWLAQQVYCSTPTVLVQPGPLGHELYYRRRGCHSVLRYSPDIGAEVAILLDDWGCPVGSIPQIGVTHRGEQWRKVFTPGAWVAMEKAFGPEMLDMFGNDNDWPHLDGFNG